MQHKPTIEDRPEQPYMGTRTTIPMSDFQRAIPAMTAKVSEWLGAHGRRPSGKPFLRYHVIDMPDRMDVELGIPVDDGASADGQVKGNVLPAGRYAVLSYTGVKNGVPANKKLLEWINEQEEEAVSHDAAHGQAFESRYETFVTDAKAERDPDKWETEIAIKLRD